MATNAKVISSYQRFAQAADSLLNITSEKNYEAALALVEQLLEEAEDSPHEPLNGLIELVSKAVEHYENTDTEATGFATVASAGTTDVTMLRLLMDQHQLSLKDFPEIGDKSLVSRILHGKRNLTKQHIQKLASRFNIDPALFF